MCKSRILDGAPVMLALIACVSASAQDWWIQKDATQLENGEWIASCLVIPGMMDVDQRTAYNWLLAVTDGTIFGRSAAGEEDVYRPWLELRARVDHHAVSRPAEGVQPSLSCDVYPGAEPDCEHHFTEYRFSFQLDGETRRRHLWAPQFVSRHFDEAGNFERSTASAWLADYPPEMFSTNDRRSIRFNFSGLRDPSRGVYQHSMAWRTTYYYGLDAMDALRRCVEDHLRYGRWQNVSEESAAAAHRKMMFGFRR